MLITPVVTKTMASVSARSCAPLLALILTLCTLCHSVSTSAPLTPLSDFPIVGSSLTSLNGEWEVSSPTQAIYITGSVPGDLITDLQNAAYIANPLYENTFKAGATWNDYVWYYTKFFTLTDADISRLTASTQTDLLLVFDGIKMGAHVYVNEVLLDTAIDQHQRYQFNLGTLHRASPFLVGSGGVNNITLVFDPKIDTRGFFMDCSGGWDWAPFSDTTDMNGFSTFSRGIWKDVYLVAVDTFALLHLKPLVYYTGDFPTQPLPAHKHADFNVNVTVYYYAPAAITEPISVSFFGSWMSQPVTASIPAGMTNIGENAFNYQIAVSAADINLWWPTGFSNVGQPWLYTLTATIATKSYEFSTTRRFGFRFFALVTGNDTNSAYIAANKTADGSDWLGMRYRINGAAFFARGSNVIPMDELEGRYQAEAHAQLVRSAHDGNMNVLRIWGGGIFLPQIFYDTADEIGMMIYHDMQVRYQTTVDVQSRQNRHQLRRLSHHPSIVIWDGCNECFPDDKSPIITIEMSTVADEDGSRAIWPASPSRGWITGVNRLTGHPNGNPLTLIYWPLFQPPPPEGVTENHGPYLHGTGIPAVNGQTEIQTFPSQLPVPLTPQPTGLGISGQFTSEFGVSVYSSFESMSSTIAANHWSIHGGQKGDNCTNGFFSRYCLGGNVMAQRNYPCDNIIMQYFGGNQSVLALVGEMPFKAQLYSCMLGQALQMKTSIEMHRSTNHHGLIIWQLNEVWPTGGWGSLEYGTTSAGQRGQVIGGRWKPLHHLLESSVFTDVIISCGTPSPSGPTDDILCYLKNDGITAFERGVVQILALDLATSQVKTHVSNTFPLAAGPAVTTWFFVESINRNTTVLLASYLNADAVMTQHTILLTEPMHLTLTSLQLLVTVASQPKADGTVDVTVSRAQSSQNAALYVTLTTRANGRFSNNVFTFYQNSVNLQFIPFGPLQLSLLQSSIRAEHVADYYQSGQSVTPQTHKVHVECT